MDCASRIVVWFVFVCVAAAPACAAYVQPEAEDEEPAPVSEPEDVLIGTGELTAVPTPIRIRSGQWWGSVDRPLDNQVWVDIRNATPGRNLTAPLRFDWTCELPTFPDSRQTMHLTRTSFNLQGCGTFATYSAPNPGQVYSATVDPARCAPAYYEVRLRCEARETTGPDAGIRQFNTTTFQLQIRGGTGEGGVHAGGGSNTHNHSWYDNGVGYVYPGIRNLGDLVARPLSGVVSLDLRVRGSGDSRLDHYMVKIDDRIATLADGRLAEFHGTQEQYPISIDTRRLTNGTHKLAFHGHVLATRFRPGNQLASQVEVFIDVQN